MNPIASYLDAAILKPEFTPAEAVAAAESCVPFKPRTLCVRPVDLELIRPLCREHGIGLCATLGFPHGCQLSASKAEEARRYLEAGADEIDMVSNIGWVRAGEWKRVRGDIEAVTDLTRPAGAPLKVIFETCFLAEKEIRTLVDVCVDAGADFVKTSTGFNGEGARDEHVRLMLEVADGRIQVKPSGGIRTPQRAGALIEMGAARLGVGTSSVPALCGQGGAGDEGY